MRLVNRRFALAALGVALTTSSAQGKDHKPHNRRCRRQVKEATVNICSRGFCSDGAPTCGAGCFCAAAGAGIGLCVRAPKGDPPTPEHVLAGQVCLETCDHPGEQRCYYPCR